MLISKSLLPVPLSGLDSESAAASAGIAPLYLYGMVYRADIEGRQQGRHRGKATLNETALIISSLTVIIPDASLSKGGTNPSCTKYNIMFDIGSDIGYDIGCDIGYDIRATYIRHDIRYDII